MLQLEIGLRLPPDSSYKAAQQPGEDAHHPRRFYNWITSDAGSLL